MNNKDRRKWTASQKLKIVLETFYSDSKVAEVCRREGIAPSLVYKWRKELMNSAEAVFAHKSKGTSRREEKLEEENNRMKSVIAEITAENLDLKKTL